MNIRGRDIMNMPVDKMQKMFDNVTRVNDSKVFSKSEEKEMKSQLLSFMGAPSAPRYMRPSPPI